MQELNLIGVLSTGGGYLPVIEPKTITANGTYTAPEGVDGYSPVTVNVPASQPVIEAKTITVNGTYTAPEGVDGYSPVTVNVPASQPVIEPKTITANGTYTAPEGVDGYSPVTVNVSTENPNIKMGNCYNQWVQTNMRVNYFDATFFNTIWDGSGELGCQLYSNFDISEFDYIKIKGESITPHYYNPSLSDVYKVGIGFSSNLPTSYADITYIDTPNYYLPNDNETFEVQYSIPNQTCYLVLNLGGWNLRNVQIELIKS